MDQLDYREIEARRAEISKQINVLISSGFSIKKIAELIGAEEFLRVEEIRGKAAPVTVLDVKKFVDFQLTQNNPLMLPSSVSASLEVVLPTDERDFILGSGKGIEKKEHIPRSQYLVELLSELGLKYSLILGKNNPEMFRELPYNIFYIFDKDVMVLVNNEEGNATFVVHGVKNAEDCVSLSQLTKSQLKLSEGKDVRVINWENDVSKWKKDIADALLSSDVTEDKKSKKDKEAGVPLEKEIEMAPVGWFSVGGLMRDLRRSGLKIGYENILSIASDFREEHEDWFRDYRIRVSIRGQKDSPEKKAGYVSEHFHPDLVRVIRERAVEAENIPTGWFSLGDLARELRCAPKVLVRIISEYQDDEHAHWFGKFPNPNRHYKYEEYYGPELARIVRERLGDKPPDGWYNKEEMTRRNQVGYGTIERLLLPFKESNSEMVKKYRPRHGGGIGEAVDHYPPSWVEAVEKEIVRYKKELAPSGWYNMSQVRKMTGIDPKSMKRYVDEYIQSHPEWFHEYRDVHYDLSIHVSQEFVDVLVEKNPIIEVDESGWYPASQLLGILHLGYDTIISRAEAFRQSHPEWFRFGRIKGKRGRPVEYYHPDLIKLIKEGK